METGILSIRIWCVVSFLVSLISLVPGTSAMSANPQQPNFDICIQEFSVNGCNSGQAKNTPSFPCKPKKRPCCPCPEGSFMDGYNNCTECKPWRDCKAEGKEVLSEGNTIEDARCGDDIPRTTTFVSDIMTTTPPPTVEGSTSSIEPNLTKDEPFMSSTTSNPTGDDDGKRGNRVKKFVGFTVLGIFIVIACLVICLFICWCSKKKPKANSGVNDGDQEGSNKKITEV